MRSFDAKVVIVTGGAQGIGGGISEAFARAGASVSVADLDAAAAEGLARELGAAGLSAQAVIADVGRAADAQRIVRQTVSAYGAVDVLINNAGIQPPDSYRNVEDLDEAVWDRIIDVNLKSQYLMSKYAIPEMRKRGGGAIINIASVQGLQSQPLVPAYAASKGGSLSLTRNMALDYASENIRVLAINPGTIDTPLARAAAATFGDPDELLNLWGGAHPLGRIGTPADIAGVALFLASDAAGFMTGESVCVDGGYMALGAWAAGTGA